MDQLSATSWESAVDTIFKAIVEGRKKTPVEDGEMRFSELHKPFIKAIVSHECVAATDNNFILTRGADGHNIRGHGTVFDLPSNSKSLSYGTRVLDGVIHDFGQTGA